MPFSFSIHKIQIFSMNARIFHHSLQPNYILNEWQKFLTTEIRHCDKEFKLSHKSLNPTDDCPINILTIQNQIKYLAICDKYYNILFSFNIEWTKHNLSMFMHGSCAFSVFSWNYFHRVIVIIDLCSVQNCSTLC